MFEDYKTPETTLEQAFADEGFMVYYAHHKRRRARPCECVKKKFLDVKYCDCKGKTLLDQIAR